MLEIENLLTVEPNFYYKLLCDKFDYLVPSQSYILIITPYIPFF